MAVGLDGGGHVSGDARVAMVTGAARGIGAATVRALCAQGYGVLAVDSCAGEADGEGLEYPLATREDLNGLAAPYGDQVVPIVADVRDRDALQVAASTGIDVFGRIDVAVAAAAVIAGGRPLWETAEDQLRMLVDVDLIGVWNTAAVAVPLMVAGPAPSNCRFVAIASSAGRHGLFGLSAYNAVKHGVVGLVRGLAEDLAGTGVTAVAVSPGSTRTAMLGATARLYGLDSVEDFTDSTLIRRLLEPAEVAEAVAFCCSEQAASLNGSVVSADGGFRS